MEFRQGAAREHPPNEAVTESQRPRKAISDSTLRAGGVSLAACCVARRSRIRWDMLPPRAFGRSQNPQPQMSSYFRDRTLISGFEHGCLRRRFHPFAVLTYQIF